MVFCNNRSGWHVVKHPLSLTSRKEKRGGSKNPFTTKMEFYVANLLKGTEKKQKNLTDTIVTQKN